MAYNQSCIQLKLKRTPDSSEIWKSIDLFKNAGYKVSTHMNSSVITIDIFPYPRDEYLAIVKDLCSKFKLS